MKNVLIFGAGAIGSTVAAWLSESDANVYFYNREKTSQKINQHGIETYCGDTPEVRHIAKVPSYSDLSQAPKPDLIILCVKNFSLHDVSQQLVDAFGADVPVVGLQNGIENQKVLPQYFNQVIYGVVCYNAWVDEVAVVGFQKKGPIALGHKGGVPPEIFSQVASLFSQGVDTEIPTNFNDAAHSKVVINLANSLTTLVALHENDLSDSREFQKLLTTMTYEGVKVMEAAGYKESKLGGMPGWLLLKAAGRLPLFLTRRPYLKNLKKMVISSMAQDVIVNGGRGSELETINGYVLSLADEFGVAVPVNRAIYSICKEEFAKQPFHPMSVADIWQRVA